MNLSCGPSGYIVGPSQVVLFFWPHGRIWQPCAVPLHPLIMWNVHTRSSLQGRKFCFLRTSVTWFIAPCSQHSSIPVLWDICVCVGTRTHIHICSFVIGLCLVPEQLLLGAMKRLQTAFLSGLGFLPWSPDSLPVTATEKEVVLCYLTC